MKRTGILLLMAITLFIICFTWSGKIAEGRSLNRTNMDQQQRDEQEKEYISEVRDYLDNSGYPNSGINLTWIQNDGYRSYTINIYHGRLEDLEDEKSQIIKDQLMNMAWTEENTDFQVVLCF